MYKIKFSDELFYYVFLLVLSISFFVHLNMFPNDNVSWSMRGAYVLLHGGNYFNYYDPTPPSTLLIYFLPTLFNSFFYTHTLITLYVTFLLTLSLLFVRPLLVEYFGDGSKGFVNLLTIFLSLILVFLPGYYFGEREHLSILFVLPYLILLANRISGKKIPNRSFLVLIGIMAGIGFTAKPYFLLAPFLIELYYLYKSKSLLSLLRYETIFIAAYAIFYVLFIIIFYPEYISSTLKFALNLYAKGDATPYLVFFTHKKIIFFYCFFALFYFAKKIGNVGILENILFFASVGYFIAYIMQNRGYQQYHLLPIQLLSLSLISIYILQIFFYKKNLITSKIYSNLICILGVIFVVTMSAFSYLNLKKYSSMGSFAAWQTLIVFTQNIEKHYSNNYIWQSFQVGQPVNDLINTLPAVTDSINATRFDNLWPLAAIYFALKSNISSKKNILKEKNFFVTATLADLNKNKPAIIFSTPKSRILLHQFDPRFDSIWPKYKLYTRYGGMDILVRK